MPMSMTGFGRGVVDAPFGRLISEIQSINRKHFEVQVHLPKELSRFENEIRKRVAEKVSRGQITVRIQLIPSKEAIADLLPDLETLKSVKAGWEKRSEQLGLDPKHVNIEFIARYVPAAQKTDLIQDQDIHLLDQCINAALQSLFVMKSKEGKALTEDVQTRLHAMRKMVLSIAEYSPEATNRMRQKLLEKMAALMPEGVEVDERIVKEVALFAEKVDITEELIRLESHFMQFEECLNSQGAVGRKMDFVIQEMGREINTIGSKSCESKISYVVVEMKSELERVREQIQNIE